jgi:hypothetical protein
MTRQRAISHSPSKFSLYRQKISAQTIAQIIAQRGFTNTVAVPSTSTTLDPRELLETTTAALGAMVNYRTNNEFDTECKRCFSFHSSLPLHGAPIF